VLGRRVILRRERRALGIAKKVVETPRRDGACRPFVERFDPLGRRSVVVAAARVGIQREVVRGAAGAEHQRAGVAQRAQCAAELEVLLRRARAVDRDLQDGHVGARKQQRCRNPGAVIEAALGLEARRHTRGR
jgi:hypothetical protein